MPFDPSTYLTSRGWQGKGIALDGPGGKGLKRPLTIPKKRDLHGLGKDRDRATQWWDCVFEAGAKALNISAGGTPDSTPATSVPTSPRPATTTPQQRLSLASHAKKEAMRRLLMSGFVRGEVLGVEEVVVVDAEESAALPPTESRKRKAEVAPTQSREERREAKSARAAAKAEKAAAKEAKAARRAARQAKKEAKEAKRLARAARESASGDVSPTKGKRDAEHRKKRRRSDDAVHSVDATSPAPKKLKKASKRKSKP